MGRRWWVACALVWGAAACSADAPRGSSSASSSASAHASALPLPPGAEGYLVDPTAALDALEKSAGSLRAFELRLERASVKVVQVGSPERGAYREVRLQGGKVEVDPHRTLAREELAEADLAFDPREGLSRLHAILADAPARAGAPSAQVTHVVVAYDHTRQITWSVHLLDGTRRRSVDYDKAGRAKRRWD